MMATVPTGLERCAAEECSEAVGRGSAAHRGSITCTLETLEDLTKVFRSLLAYITSLLLQFDQLRSIDNYQAVVGTLPQFCKDEVYTVCGPVCSLCFLVYSARETGISAF